MKAPASFDAPAMRDAMTRPSRSPGTEETAECSACDLTAIPAGERPVQVALVRELFATGEPGVREIPGGLELERLLSTGPPAS